MKNIKLPVYPNKLLDDLNDENLISAVNIKINEENNHVMLQREINNLLFDKKYNPSQSASDYFKIHLKNTASNIKSFLKENGLNEAKCIDVGCGKGEFVNLLNEDNYFNCIGFDTSFEGSNNKIHKRYLNINDFDTNVNLVILKYVLDYIYPPNEFLGFLKKIYPNAYIFIEGPLIEDTVKKNRFYDICFEQINYFSKKSYSNFFDDKILKSGDTFGNQYYYLISRLEYFNENSLINFKQENFKKIDLDNLFPQMKIQLENFKKVYDITDKLWFWGAARKTVMFLHHFFEYYNLDLNQQKIECVDQNISKEGKYLPSSKIKISSVKNLLKKLKIKDKIIISNPLYGSEIKNFLNSNLEFEPKLIIL
tara:strand:+ start:523 stop:1620 length:1098 start_codon:yes stop_codon:yes gene_type:complete